MGKLRHLGIKDAPKKSTLSYANMHRPWEMFRDLFYATLDLCKGAAQKKGKFRFKNKLLSLDSTTIALCLSLFPWAGFRRTKGAVKLHLLLDHDGYFPTYAYVSNGKKHDVTIARKVPLPPGSIVTMDRGYNEYKLFASWTENGIYFVTRMKDNAGYTVVEEGLIPSPAMFSVINWFIQRILSSKRLSSNPPKGGGLGWKERARDHSFDYKVIVTNKTESAKSVVPFHNNLGAQDGLFGDAKNDAALDIIDSIQPIGIQSNLHPLRDDRS